MSDSDDRVRSLLEAAAGSPTLVARDALLDSLVERIEAGGEDVAEAPSPLTLTAVPGGKPLRARVARVSSIGMAGIVVLAAGTAAAASVGAWLTFGPKAPPLPVMTTDAPVVDPSGVPPIDSPRIEKASNDTDDVVVPPLLEPALDAPLPGELGEVLPTDVPGDFLAPVISSISVGELSGSLLELLECTATAPIRVTATDDAAVTSVAARVTAVGDVNVSIPLVHDGNGTWTGTLGGLSLLNAIPLNSVATVAVEARDTSGNTTTAQVDVPLHTLVCG